MLNGIPFATRAAGAGALTALRARTVAVSLQSTVVCRASAVDERSASATKRRALMSSIDVHRFKGGMARMPGGTSAAASAGRVSAGGGALKHVSIALSLSV